MSNEAASRESPATTIVWNDKEERFETEDRAAFLQYHLRDVAAAAAAPAAVAFGDVKKSQRTKENEEEEESAAAVVTVMDMVHTYVPRSKRGKGLAARLCDAAFAHARRHSMLVIPTCSYISETFLPRNPGWNSIVYNEERRSSV